MFGLSMMELLIVAVIALIVIGPEKFPDFAKIAMRTVRDLRGYMDEVQRDLSKELKPVKKEMNTLSRYSAEDYIDALAKSDQKNGDKGDQADEQESNVQEETGPDKKKDSAGSSAAKDKAPQAQPDDTADAPTPDEPAAEPAESTAETAPNKPRFYQPPDDDQD